MRHMVPLALALAIVTCGGSSPVATSATPLASPSPSATPSAMPSATYAPTAEAFSSKVLVEKPRTLSTSAMGFIWIVAGAATDASVVAATLSEKESFTASYESSTDRGSVDGGRLAYATPDLPPLPAGRYTEGLRLVVVQSGGRSAAHMHSGIEAVFVLEGRVLVRSAGNAPSFLDPGQGFYILPKVPVQLINVGNAVARTLVYSISPEGAPFSTELSQAP